MSIFLNCDLYHFREKDLLWPIHLKPKPDELLSSWLIRFAHAHGYKAQTMCVFLFGRNEPIWNRDIDRCVTAEIGNKLMAATGATSKQFEDTTLKGYEGWLYKTHQANGMNRWLVPLGIYNRKRQRSGLAFCPKCLSEDIEPYFRRQWRLAFSTVCTKHKCKLIDSCPSCQSSIVPHRTDMQSKNYFPTDGILVRCWKCGFRLSQSPVTQERNRKLIKFQLMMEKALKQGYIPWAGNPSMHSIIFFDGIRKMIAGITSKATLKRLDRASIMKGVNLSSWDANGLELYSIEARRELFGLIAKLCNHWPNNFTKHIHMCHLRYSDLKAESNDLPFWYEDVIRREASGGFSKISQIEAESIATIIERENGQFSFTKARKQFGRDLTDHLPDRSPQPISDDEYEDLLTSIDHQIAGTQKEGGRANLIRDKIMFAASRQFGLTLTEISNLTLNKVRELAPDIVEQDFSEVARSPAQARAWVEWYCRKIRPRFNPAIEENRIFTSSSRGVALKKSFIGLRFKTAVEVGMMQRKITSYSGWITKSQLNTPIEK